MNSAIFYVIFFAVIGFAWIAIGFYYMYRKNNLAGRDESLKTMLRNVPAGIVEINQDGSFGYCNEMAERLLEIKKSALSKGESQVDIYDALHVSGKNISKKRNPFWRAVNRWQPIRNEVIGLGRGKETMWLQVSSEPVYSSDAKIQSAFISFVDVTRRVESERIVKEQQDALFRNARISSMGSLASGVAHEINNPMTIISGLTDIAMMRLNKLEEPPLPVIDSLGKIQNAVNKVVDIVNSMRALSPSSMAEPFERTPLIKPIHAALNLSGAYVRSFDIAVEVNCPEDLYISCRPADVSQALINMIANAVDATKELEEKWIKINAESRDDQVILSITDSGTGIDPENCMEIYNAFYTTKAQSKGAGLGLTIAEQIIHEHKGELSLDPNDPHTCFHIHFPKAALQAAGEVA